MIGCKRKCLIDDMEVAVEKFQGSGVRVTGFGLQEQLEVRLWCLLVICYLSFGICPKGAQFPNTKSVLL